MRQFFIIVKRNIKMYFKDRGLFISSMITPVILLLLYATFLAKVYKDAFTSALPEEMNVAEKLINGCVGGELLSSLLAVCAVTVAFCSNIIMIQDKFTSGIKDFNISPVRRSKIASGYLAATFVNTLIVCSVTCGIGFVYLAATGWYLSFADVLLILLDVILLSLFGTVLSSIIFAFLSTQGQASAAGTIVSAGYGFLCGAYMPISSFGAGLQKVLGFLPGTYGTSLVRNHSLSGVFAEMSKSGFPVEVIEGIKDSIDCNLYFFGSRVEIWHMYLILIISDLLLIGIYILINAMRLKRRKL
ncbi:MAG: ABC transporter permease [Christensenellales bacterium]